MKFYRQDMPENYQPNEHGFYFIIPMEVKYRVMYDQNDKEIGREKVSEHISGLPQMYVVGPLRYRLFWYSILITIAVLVGELFAQLVF